MLKLARLATITSSAWLWLAAAGKVFAQTATDSAGKGGTDGALPDAGSTELTYLLFIGGALLFVVGFMKLVLSFRQD